MQPPGFWQRPRLRPGLVARLLAPVAAIWAIATARRVERPARCSAGVPVICVGNLTLGGAGKTPTVTALVERLAARGIAAHVLTRGHGGRLTGPIRVDLASHTADDVGDEPLLHAAIAPTWVSRDRCAGARAAVDAGAGAIVMDDGHQNPDLKKDLSIVVVDAETGFGNGRVVPAGPLREPVREGLARAGLVLGIGLEPSQRRLGQDWPEIADVPRISGTLVPLATGMQWQGLRCVAFAGIGRPEKFFASLRAVGADVAATHAFADHAVYPRAILDRLLSEAQRLGAQPVTTEKDAVRLPPDVRPKVLAFPVRLQIDDPAPLDAALDQLFGPAPSG